ncbi:putative Major facilitator superfamily domain-containing protein [Seiridium cardinale]
MDAPTSPEKAEIAEKENASHGRRRGSSTVEEEIGRIDAMAEAPGVSVESFAHLDEKKILRKMDLRLIPMLAALYLLSFLDRGNIGNAKIEGLQEDLNMTADQYWGTVMTLMGIVRSYSGLLAARFFLGVAEAGLYPGCAAMFFSAASIAGNLEGWRWIFILEGIATVIIAAVAFLVLHDFPETATFLTEEERAFVVFRLKYGQDKKATEEGRASVAEAEDFQWKYVWQAFRDWQIWTNIFVYWGIVCPLYGISLFLPTIINNLGYTSSTAQLLTVPIYITAAILAVVFAYISDRVGKRSPFVITFLCTMIVGFAMCISTSNPRVVYAGVFIAACSIYPSFPGNIAWLSNNLAGSYKRSAGMAMQIGIGNLGGAMASNFYRARDSPRYLLGHGLELAFISVGIIAAIIQVFSYKAINKRRGRIMSEGGDQLSQKELAVKGDKANTFRYMY